MPSGFATLRDLTSFLAGLALLGWSLVFSPPPPEPLSVAVGVALVGLPAATLMGGGRGSDKRQVDA